MIDNLIIFSGVILLAWAVTRCVYPYGEVRMKGKHVAAVAVSLFLWFIWIFNRIQEAIRP